MDGGIVWNPRPRRCVSEYTLKGVAINCGQIYSSYRIHIVLKHTRDAGAAGAAPASLRGGGLGRGCAPCCPCARAGRARAAVGRYPIVTSATQRLNTMGNVVWRG